MVRPSNPKRSPEAQETKPNTRSVSEPELEPQPRPQPRHSLEGGEPEFSLQAFQNAFARDPQRLFDQIVNALRLRDDSQEQNATLQAEAIVQQEEALAQRQEMAELMIQNEQLQSELL